MRYARATARCPPILRSTASCSRKSQDLKCSQTPVTPPEFSPIRTSLTRNISFLHKTHNAEVADFLADIDAAVGQLLDAVDKLGIRDKTTFVFTSDTGPEFSTG